MLTSLVDLLLSFLFSPDISSSYVSRLDPDHRHHHGHVQDLEEPLPSNESCKCSCYTEPHERTPLVTSQTAIGQRTRELATHTAVQFFPGHHHFESRASHCTDGPVTPRALPKQFCDTHENHSDVSKDHIHRTETEPNLCDSSEDCSTTIAGLSQDPSELPESEIPESPASSPRRQIVGILVSVFIACSRTGNRSYGVRTGSASRDHDPLVRHRPHPLNYVRARVQ